MSVLGIVCNVLNIYVLSRFRIKCCFHRLLCFLALFDIFTLLFGAMGVLNIFKSELDILCKNPSFQVVALIMNKVEYFMVHGSSWLTVGISLERYLGICYPLKYPVRFRKARFFLIPVILISLLDTAILHFFFKDRFILHTLPSHAFPIMLIIFFNLNIILTMMKMVDMPGSHQENVAEGALVLFGVVVAFTICWAPPLIKNILKETFQTYQLEWIQVLNQVGWCTVAINSSINFFIYCLVGKQYREHFRAVFTCFSTPRPHNAGGKENTKNCFLKPNMFQVSGTTLTSLDNHFRQQKKITVVIVL